MARRLIEPLWKVVVEKGDDATKFRTLEALVAADPAGTLEKIESAKFAQGRESRIRTGSPPCVGRQRPRGGRGGGRVDRRPRVRAGGLDRPGRRRSRPASPAQARPARSAALHARAAPSWTIDSLDGPCGRAAVRAGRGREGQGAVRRGPPIAKEFTDKTDFRRGSFAAQLALVDLPAALAIAKDFSGVREQGRILTNLAFRLIEKDPAEAERIWKQGARMGRVGRDEQALAWKMAAVDPGRARRVIESLAAGRHAARYVHLPRPGRRKRDEAASRTGARRRAPSPRPAHARSARTFQFIAGSLLPIVERIDPAVVPEVFWRDVASRPPFGNPRTISAVFPSHLISISPGTTARSPRRFRAEREPGSSTPRTASWRPGELRFPGLVALRPRAAVDRLEKVPVSHDAGADANAARIAVAGSLGLSYEGRWRKVLDRLRDRPRRPRRGF